MGCFKVFSYLKDYIVGTVVIFLVVGEIVKVMSRSFLYQELRAGEVVTREDSKVPKKKFPQRHKTTHSKSKYATVFVF